MKNLLINYVNGSNQTFTGMTEKEANDFNSELHSHGDWMKFRNTTIRKSNICHIDTWGGTCKECGYLVDNHQVSRSSATPVFYIHHNIRFVVCQCYNKSYTVLS